MITDLMLCTRTGGYRGLLVIKIHSWVRMKVAYHHYFNRGRSRKTKHPSLEWCSSRPTVSSLPGRLTALREGALYLAAVYPTHFEARFDSEALDPVEAIAVEGTPKIGDAFQFSFELNGLKLKIDKRRRIHPLCGWILLIPRFYASGAFGYDCDCRNTCYF